MTELLKKKWILIVILLATALLSFFVLSGIMSSPDFHKDTLDGLEEKQTTVLELSAASTAASAAITLIPGDAATPIAEKLADLSSHFLLVLCAIFLEKYLLTITGTVTFSILIPAACILCILHILSGQKILRQLAIKLTVFAVLIFLVIPASVKLSDMIENTYHASIQQTVESAKENAAAIEGTVQVEEAEDEGFLSGIVSSVTNGVNSIISDMTEWASETLNGFIEALAVMLVTCCLIPILVLAFFVWLAKTILAVEIPVNYSALQHGLKGKLLSKKSDDL